MRLVDIVQSARPVSGLAGTVAGAAARRAAAVSSGVATQAAQTSGRTVMAAGGLARGGLRAAEASPQPVAWAAKALFDLHPRRTHRRVWDHQGHAQIEVRGAIGTGSRSRRVAAGARRALS